MKNNFDYLIEQFKHAKGIKKADIYSKSFVSDFAAWLHERKLIGEEFISFLDYLGLSYEDANCAEIGKGDKDTIVKPYDTKIISLSGDSITDVDRDRIIVANFKVYEDNACALINNELTIIPNSDISTYLVHNPYSFNSINGLENLHNNNTHDIIVGIYGHCSDKDRAKKMERIELLKSKLERDYIYDSDTFEEAYYCVIGSVSNKEKNIYKMR